MLVQLGQRAARQEGHDAVDLLIECHGRIRRFLSFARQLAVAHAPDGEVQAVAGQIRRYFAVAFPLHLADEEQLVVPALAAAGEPIAAALAEMRAEHAAHDRDVARLVELCGELERVPAALVRLGEQLGAVAGELTRELEAHLAGEERVIFPALRALPAAERDAILRGMRARRDRVV